MLSLERRASAAAPQKQCEANQNFGAKQFSSPFFTQILHKVHLLAQQNLSSCSCGHFRDLLKSPHPTISLCPAPMFFNNLNRDYSTNCTKHCTPEKFFEWEHVCLFVERPNVPQYWKDFSRDGMVLVIPAGCVM